MNAPARLSASPIQPDSTFLGAIESATGQPVSGCYRCLKCSAGCPMAEEMDFPPDRLIRMAQLGLRQEALQSRALWLCTGCLACSQRCPNGIDVARVIDAMKEIALVENAEVGDRRIVVFHQSFLGTIKRYGRLHEATLIALLKVRSGNWTADVGSGIKMFIKGKLPVLPQRIKGGRQVARLFAASEERGAQPPAGGRGQ